MQITCEAVDWRAVEPKKENLEALIEAIFDGALEEYFHPIPEEQWSSDSSRQYFEVTECLALLMEKGGKQIFPGLEQVAELLSDGESIDELGLGPFSEDSYFATLSPQRVAELDQVFSQLNPRAIAVKCAQFNIQLETPEIIQLWLEQWRDALRFAVVRGFGLFGHCG